VDPWIFFFRRSLVSRTWGAWGRDFCITIFSVDVGEQDFVYAQTFYLSNVEERDTMQGRLRLILVGHEKLILVVVFF
jgi:hypothetical protein